MISRLIGRCISADEFFSQRPRAEPLTMAVCSASALQSAWFPCFVLQPSNWCFRRKENPPSTDLRSASGAELLSTSTTILSGHRWWCRRIRDPDAVPSSWPACRASATGTLWDSPCHEEGLPPLAVSQHGRERCTEPSAPLSGKSFGDPLPTDWRCPSSPCQCVVMKVRSLEMFD